MKKLFSVLTALVLCIFVLSAADSSMLQVDKWGMLSVKSVDGMTGELVIPETIDGITVTSISNNAFKGCNELTSVYIPDTVTTVNGWTFYECEKLESVRLPEGLTEIDNRTFYKCSNLKYVNIPSTVTTIGSSAFYYCSSLEHINFPESLTKIKDSAFERCSSLREVALPASLSSIGTYVFEYCKSLESLTVDPANTNFKAVNGVLYNGDMTRLYLCSSACTDTHFIVPDSVTKFETFSFYDNHTVTRLTIPASVTSIADAALRGCPLEFIEVSPDNPEFCSMDGVLYKKDAATLVRVPQNYTSSAFIIPDSVTKIGNYAFFDCAGIREIYFPASLSKIGSAIFRGCTSLENIYVSGDNPIFLSEDGILYDREMTTLIKYPSAKASFRGSIEIPLQVKAIFNYAIDGCAGLKRVSTHPGCSLAANSFALCSDMEAVDFSGSLEEWKNVKKSSSWSSGLPATCIVYCTDGSVGVK